MSWVIKVPLKELVAAKGPLERLCEQPVAAKTAESLSSILEIVNESARPFYEARAGLAEKLGEPLPDGKTRIVPDKVEEFTGELEKVLGQEVELPAAAALKRAVLDELKLSAADFAAIKFLIPSGE